MVVMYELSILIARYVNPVSEVAVHELATTDDEELEEEDDSEEYERVERREEEDEVERDL